MDEHFAPSVTGAEKAELQRRQRVRNLAMLAALVAVAALFYAIAVVRFKVS